MGEKIRCAGRRSAPVVERPLPIHPYAACRPSAPLALGCSALATVMFSVTPPVSISSRALARLPSTFNLPDFISSGTACIGGCRTDADLLAREIVELEVKLKSEDPEEVAEDKATMGAKWEKLAKVKKDIGTLKAFYKDAINQWCDIAHRNISHVGWAPEISVNVQGRNVCQR